VSATLACRQRSADNDVSWCANA